MTFKRLALFQGHDTPALSICSMLNSLSMIVKNTNTIFLQRNGNVCMRCVSVRATVKLSFFNCASWEIRYTVWISCKPDRYPAWRNWRISAVFWGQLCGFPTSDQQERRGEKNVASEWKLGRQQKAADEWFSVLGGNVKGELAIKI